MQTGYLGFMVLACLSVPNLASAAATMETIGAEKCGGRVTAFKVEFLAPDGAALEATAKVLVRGAPSLLRMPSHCRSTGSRAPKGALHRRCPALMATCS